MGRKQFATAAIAAAFLFAAPAGAETVLRMSSWVPPSHPISRGMMAPWAEKVEAATNGRVKVQILDAPLGAPPAHFDLAADGIVDVTFGVHGYTPGRFKLTQLVELPFLSNSATALSVAYWRVHEAMLADAGEHDGVKLLGLFTHGPGMLWTTDTPVSPLSGLAGAKIRVAGAISQKVITALGMSGIQAPAPQSYEILAGGVADGIVFPMESLLSFKLLDILQSGLRVDGGLYNVSFFLVMNEDAFNSLPAEDQAAIESVSGEAFARLAGGAWEAADAASAAAMGDVITVTEPSTEDLIMLNDAAQPLYDGVAASFAEAGLNFEAALSALKAEIVAAQ